MTHNDLQPASRANGSTTTAIILIIVSLSLSGIGVFCSFSQEAVLVLWFWPYLLLPVGGGVLLSLIAASLPGVSPRVRVAAIVALLLVLLGTLSLPLALSRASQTCQHAATPICA